MSDVDKPDWKLSYRYGRLKTPFQHYSLIADGVADELRHGFECRPGRAFMGIKVWATSQDEAFHMTNVIGADIGFHVSGKIHLYSTPPEEPPGEEPNAYDISFTPYDESSKTAP